MDQGYVERAGDPADGRASLHHLTPAGVELRNRLKKAVRTWFEEALDDFDDDDRAAFASLLGRFVDHLGVDLAKR